MESETDTSLWERACRGDGEAFGDLYERHARAVHAFCLWRTGDPASAEDLAATVFLEAWRRREAISPSVESARPLLLGVATNVVRSHWRTRRRHASALGRLRLLAPDTTPGHEEDVIARVDALQRLREMRDTVRHLPRRELEVLALVAWSGLTYDETSIALSIPVGTVRSRLSRARARLGDASPGVNQMPVSTKGPTS